MPDRVLDVSPTAWRHEVRLVQTNGMQERYAVLSYCWGGPQPNRTSTSNLQARRGPFHQDILPATIKDAITVTRRLGIRYLWIDSVCLAEDALHENARQVGLMDDIFRNSYLTISASHAQSSNTGFLGHVDLRFDAQGYTGELLHDRACELPVRLVDNQLGTVELRRLVNYDISQDAVAERAWTLQERMLSSRVLSFGRCISWMCHAGKQLDNCTGDIWTVNYEHNWFVDCPLPRTLPNLETEAIKLWQNTVRDYSRMKVTFEEDKLPALAGLASRFSKMKNSDVYLAGLWRTHLPLHLMWELEGPATRPTTWRAPSWSWASLDGGLRYYVDYDQDYLITFQDYRRQLVAEESPFGGLAEASLTVEGCLGRTTRFLYTSGTETHELLGTSQLETGRRRVLDGKSMLQTGREAGHRSFTIDTDADKLSPQPMQEKISNEEKDGVTVLGQDTVWLLPVKVLYTSDLTQRKWKQGLLLAAGAADTYRRIGTFTLEYGTTEEDIEWSETGSITLV